MATRIEGDTYVNGNVSCKTLSIPAGTVDNADVASDAAIAATKCVQRHKVTYQQNGNAASETVVLTSIYGATGTNVAFEAGSVTIAAGAATVTVDLKKNGTTCLTGVITLDTGNSAYVPEAGTLSVTALADGDVLTAVITATAGGGTLPTGFYCTLVYDEDPA